MLVEMNLSVWTAQKNDKGATAKVTTDANARSDAGNFKKNLMAGTNRRKEIADYAAMCRTWHNGKTLPWSDKGVRLLPTSLFLAYKSEINTRRAEFDTMVAAFLAEYPTLVAAAHRHMGSLFDPNDYPHVDEVATKFGFRTVFSPVPEAGDFRLDVPKAEMAELKTQYEVAYEARVDDAMGSAWTKFYEMLKGMSDKLVEPEDGTKVFHATFTSNAVELCEMLTHLNITKDPHLEKSRRDLEKAIANVDIADIRKDAGTRADVKAQVDAILDAYDW